MVTAGEGPKLGDAFGCALSDMHAGGPGAIFVERDDGLLEVDASDYLSRWSDQDTWRWSGHRADAGPGHHQDPVPAAGHRLV
jgi:hypothetical protein